MQSPSFEQEYNLKYLGNIGDLFNPYHVDACIHKYKIIDEYTKYRTNIMGIDPAYSTGSYFAIVIVSLFEENEQEEGDLFKIIYHKAVKREKLQNMIDLVTSLIADYNIFRIFVDASASHTVDALHYEYDEEHVPIELELEYYLQQEYPMVMPIPFNKYGDKMMQTLQKVVSDQQLHIHKDFQEVITALKSAKSKAGNPYSINKEKSVGNDTLDTLRISLMPLVKL
jgi:hypothetical protein